MPLEHDYQRVAERSLDASDASLKAGIQEKSTFLAYHAFESTGCALSVVKGVPVGPHVRHNDKIRNFMTAAARGKCRYAVAALAVSIASIRNKALYPIQDARTGVMTRPESAITEAQARKLNKRVKGIVGWVGTQI